MHAHTHTHYTKSRTPSNPLLFFPLFPIRIGAFPVWSFVRKRRNTQGGRKRESKETMWGSWNKRAKERGRDLKLLVVVSYETTAAVCTSVFLLRSQSFYATTHPFVAAAAASPSSFLCSPGSGCRVSQEEKRKTFLSTYSSKPPSPILIEFLLTQGSTISFCLVYTARHVEGFAPFLLSVFKKNKRLK